MATESIIVIGAGELQIPVMKAAIRLGYRVIAFDINPQAPGMILADRAVLASTQNPDECVDEAHKLSRFEEIRGVITVGTDASVTVAHVARSLGLAGIDPEDALAASDKLIMRERLKMAGIAIPEFCQVNSLEDVFRGIESMGFPLVLKPARNMGARGVIKIDDEDNINSNYEHAMKYAKDGRLILEQFMDGPELSVDALAWNNKKWMTGIADRIIGGEPYFIESGHNMPSSFSGEILHNVRDIMFRSMDALGLVTGAAKGDIKITPDGIKIGEVAARLSGGFMSTHTFPIASEIDLMASAIRIATNKDPQIPGFEYKKYSIERGIVNREGVLKEIRGIKEAREVPGIEDIFLSVQKGDILNKATSNVDKIGHIIASGDTLAEATEAIAEAEKRLSIIIENDSALSEYSARVKQIEAKARKSLGAKICRVCGVCDGVRCSSGVPGMGGAGDMSAFHSNIADLRKIKIVPSLVNENITPELDIELFNRKLSSPIMPAPITGIKTNMGGWTDDEAYSRMVGEASLALGILGWYGDGADPEKYLKVLKGMKESGDRGIFITKPFSNDKDIVTRMEAAEKAGATAFGVDIDSVALATMSNKNVSLCLRSADQWKNLRSHLSIPFVLKGVLNAEDAQKAIDAGVDAIVVSNHGGRLNDGMISTCEALPEIVKVAGKYIKIIADGGVRSGSDAYKYLSLGADAVLVGRPTAIYAAGGQKEAIEFLFNSYNSQLRSVMKLTARRNIFEIIHKSIYGNGNI